MPTIEELEPELTSQHRAAPTLQDLQRRRIARHRRRTAGITLGLAVIAVGAVLAGPLAVGGPEPVEKLATASNQVDPTSPELASSRLTRDLVIDPAGPLRAGQTILVDLPGIGTDTTPLGKDPVDPEKLATPAGTPITIAQCDASVIEHLGRPGEQAEIENRCMGQVADSSQDVSFLIMGGVWPWTAFMDGLPNKPGTVRPCTDHVGQCVLIATVGARWFDHTPGTDPTEQGPWYVAPLEIAPGEFTPPDYTARIVNPPAGGLEDGATVMVAIEHLTPGSWAWAQQCQLSASPKKEDCDFQDAASSTIADGHGTATLTITVRSTIQTDAAGPVPCASCVIRIGPVGGPPGQPDTLSIPLEFTG